MRRDLRPDLARYHARAVKQPPRPRPGDTHHLRVCQARAMPKATRPSPEMTLTLCWRRRPVYRRRRAMAVDKVMNQLVVPRPMPASRSAAPAVAPVMRAVAAAANTAAQDAMVM